MPAKDALFAGLVVDEYDNPVTNTYVGEEPMYVVNDNGFHRHIPSEDIDRAVLSKMGEMIEGNEDLLSEEAAKMMGQEDIFSIAMLTNQLKNLDQQFDQILNAGIPEEGRVYLGMAGFKIRINIHGEVVEVIQPERIDPEI
ncbi:MAG: hypothetical protein N2D54_02375 [Chloroflexota bacterium]